MRMSYSPAAHFFLFLVQWTDCSLAGALGLLRILIYKVLSVPPSVPVVWRGVQDLMPFCAVLPLLCSSKLCCAGLCGWEYHHVHA
jgi:hypothetical protein